MSPEWHENKSGFKKKKKKIIISAQIDFQASLSGGSVGRKTRQKIIADAALTVLSIMLYFLHCAT